MARPKNKEEMLAAANDQWGRFWNLIDELPADPQTIVLDFDASPKHKEAHWTRDKNLRDVLVHLYEWHELVLDWTEANFSGDDKPFLPAPYTWKTYGDMNVEFWEKHQHTSYEDAQRLLQESHDKMMDVANRLTDKELFVKKHFPWTGTTNLGSYFISATSSHYDWAIKKIRRYLKDIDTE